MMMPDRDDVTVTLVPGAAATHALTEAKTVIRGPGGTVAGASGGKDSEARTAGPGVIDITVYSDSLNISPRARWVMCPGPLYLPACPLGNVGSRAKGLRSS